MLVLARRVARQFLAAVVGLLLLVVITVLAVSGMNTATTELAIARNDQNYEFAFQAAEELSHPEYYVHAVLGKRE